MNRGVDTNERASWLHFHHEADIGVRGWGPDPARAFEQAALALTAVMVEPEALAPAEAVAIECAAPSRDLLLYEWLNAVIYETAVRRMLFGRFEVRLDDGRLQATAWGEPVDLERHQPAVEVKGATLTELAVTQSPAGEWIAQCVVDV